MLVRVQALVKMFLARCNYKRQKIDPDAFMLVSPPHPSKQWFRFERVQREQIDEGLDSATRVEKVLAKLGAYIYGDVKSEQMLSDLDEQVMKRPEVKTADEDARYLGQWSGSRRHGHGQQVWPDGQRYDGYWANNEFNGHGRMIYPDGSYYVGYWIDNERSGQGKLVRNDCTCYEGCWKNDSQHGQGSETWQDGIFHGYYENGMRHGHGKFSMFD